MGEKTWWWKANLFMMEEKKKQKTQNQSRMNQSRDERLGDV